MSIDMPTTCWFYRWYVFYVDNMKIGNTNTAKGRHVLTDTKVRALHGRMLKGEKVGKESDGG